MKLLLGFLALVFIRFLVEVIDVKNMFAMITCIGILSLPIVAIWVYCVMCDNTR